MNRHDIREGLGRDERTPRIDIDGPDVDFDLGARLLYRGELFTGEVEERLGGDVVSLQSYVDGLPHGPSWEWYRDGTLSAEGTVYRSRPVGVWRRWHPNGVLAHEKTFSEDGQVILSHRAWDESGRLTGE
ncbi:hypothetical protein [Streptomyces plumbiresistens]|uniref:MORN repeat variant n=1 Tax=Streptomyces plumbiresistens TaxID=511811 RepID=A0ABP7TY13_9ACTN